MRYQFTRYFEDHVLRKRPYIMRQWCIQTVENPLRVQQQPDNRFRFWAEIPDVPGRFLRVVTLGDRVTIHNAFFDRRFKP